MSKTKRLSVAVLSALTFFCVAGGLPAVLSSAESEAGAQAETYSFGDLPYHTGYANFDYYTQKSNADYKIMVGLFDASITDYGLTAFDTWSADTNSGNTIGLSTADSAFSVENWRWTFAANTSVVVVVRSKIKGTIDFDFSASTLGGWMDAWNSVYSVHRYNAEGGTLDTLVNYFHGTDSVTGGTLADAAFTTASTYSVSVDVKAGDVVYYEIGSLQGRNVQNLHTAQIVATPAAADPMEGYNARIDAVVAALTRENYTAESWVMIEGYVSAFKSGTYETEEDIQAAFDTAKANIEAVAPDSLVYIRGDLLAKMNAYYASLNGENYGVEDWATITAAYNDYLEGESGYEDETSLRAFYDAQRAAMSAVKAQIQTVTYLDFPKTMNANGYDWIAGDVTDVKLYTGSVSGGLVEFDSQGTDENTMYNAELYESDPTCYVQNWKWYVGIGKGVIVAYRANRDCSITIESTRVANGGGAGWTEDCLLNVYIVRDGNAKLIKTVSSPSKDEDFGGTYYVKEGDVLYVEFTTLVALSARNTETPYATTAIADATAFDADLYAEQNNDLPLEVTAEIEAKKAALQNYYDGLNESDYSATNWLLLSDYIAQFESKCETEVATVEDVDALYDSIYAEMTAVKTLAQAAAELQEVLDGYVAELRAEYDSLIAKYKYTDADRERLDRALADGIASVQAAKTKAAGNTAKSAALSAMRAIEKSEKSKGCGGVAFGGGFASVALIGAAITVLVVTKKKENK
ncbi:MAG: hypothetical protein ACI4ST_01010 [Candidatus Gallimonas sp.]